MIHQRAIVVPVLAETLETLYGSGGGITAKTDALNAQSASRVGELSDKLEALAKDYPLQLPPYSCSSFALSAPSRDWA